VLGIFVLNRKFLWNSTYKKYFIPAFLVKLFGALFAGIIYEFYYGGGAWDTFNFYNMGTVIYDTFYYKANDAIRLLLLDSGDYSQRDLLPYISKFYSWYYREDAAFLIGKISGFFGIFCFNSYSTIACMFACISFAGNWGIFIVFSKIFPEYINKLVIPILYIPSVIFWGSGLFKDSIVFGCLGIATYCFYVLFYEKKNIIINSILICITSYTMYIIKEYVFAAFLTSLILLLIQKYRNEIKNNTIRLILAPLIFLGFLTYAYSSINSAALERELNIKSTIYTIQNMQDWHAKVSSQSSTYTLGNYDPSISGILQKTIPAINVALFRPYIWEANGLVMILSALESHIFFLIFLSLFIKQSPKKIFRIITNEPFIFFSLSFSIILGFIVGFSTYNFGALVRYKIPFLPFFLSAIIIIKNYSINKLKKINE
jgi:hypothetical protein